MLTDEITVMPFIYAGDRIDRDVTQEISDSSKVVVTGLEADKIDLMACFDQYVWYSREIARGFPVGFERFHQMVHELGHDVTEYHDSVEGHNKYQASGLKMAEVGIADKWKHAV